jgi:hypothetical protein
LSLLATERVTKEAEDEPVLTDIQMAELSALADGTLAADRRPAVEALLASSPEIREQFELERRLVERLHAARAADRAPAALRERIEADRARGAARRRRGLALSGRRWLSAWPVAGVTGAVAAVVAAIVILAGGSGGPALSSVAALAQRAATVPSAPAPGNSAVLAAHVGSATFPARLTSAGLDLTATGERTDRVDDRLVVTVYYAGQGAHVAYSIVAQPTLSQPAQWHSQGAPYALLTLVGRRSLVWQNNGHTCVISSTNLSAQTLRSLV